MGEREAAQVSAAPGRRDRRRAQIRAQLIDAARLLFARQGVDATRINEITETADVGFGSFYNHFSSKDAIVEAVLAETVESQGAAVRLLTEGLEDPAERVSVAHRYFVRLAASDPDWAWLLVRLDVSHKIAVNALGPFAARDLKIGLDADRFDVPDAEVALVASGGALLGVMRAVLDGSAKPGVDVAHAVGVLRMLGLSRSESEKVAARPMPADRPAAP